MLGAAMFVENIRTEFIREEDIIETSSIATQETRIDAASKDGRGRGSVVVSARFIE